MLGTALFSRPSCSLAPLEPAQNPRVILRDAGWTAGVGYSGLVGLGMKGDGVGQEFPVRRAGPGASVCEGSMQEPGSRYSDVGEGRWGYFLGYPGASL